MKNEINKRNIITELLKIGIYKIGGLAGGLLGAFGGADNSSKLWRRLGIPLLISVLSFIIIKRWEVLSIMSLYAVLTIGYGIPSPPILPDIDPGDEGSPLGRFFYNLFHMNWKYQEVRANIFTRGTIALLSCLTFLYIPIIKSNWIIYIVGSIITILVYATLSWKTLGSVTIFGKSLIWSEIIPYSTLTIFAMFLIF